MQYIPTLWALDLLRPELFYQSSRMERLVVVSGLRTIAMVWKSSEVPWRRLWMIILRRNIQFDLYSPRLRRIAFLICCLACYLLKIPWNAKTKVTYNMFWDLFQILCAIIVIIWLYPRFWKCNGMAVKLVPSKFQVAWPQRSSFCISSSNDLECYCQFCRSSRFEACPGMTFSTRKLGAVKALSEHRRICVMSDAWLYGCVISAWENQAANQALRTWMLRHSLRLDRRQTPNVYPKLQGLPRGRRDVVRRVKITHSWASDLSNPKPVPNLIAYGYRPCQSYRLVTTELWNKIKPVVELGRGRRFLLFV